MGGSKCCWFFLKVTKNFRAGWLPRAQTPFVTFLFPSKVVVIISGPMNLEVRFFRQARLWAIYRHLPARFICNPDFTGLVCFSTKDGLKLTTT